MQRLVRPGRKGWALNVFHIRHKSDTWQHHPRPQRVVASDRSHNVTSAYVSFGSRLGQFVP
eukprot:5477030-Amphidinium_carterae.1